MITPICLRSSFLSGNLILDQWRGNIVLVVKDEAECVGIGFKNSIHIMADDNCKEEIQFF
jgi:hypothetical protein